MKIEGMEYQNLVISKSDYDKQLENSNVWALKLKLTNVADSQESADDVIKDKPLFPGWIPSNKVDALQVTKKQRKSESFHSVMKIPLLLGQCIGMVPVSGFWYHDLSKLRFTVKSLAFWYSLFLCLEQGVACLLSALRLIWLPPGNSLLGFIFFNGSVFLNSVLFFRIARKWPALVKETEATELGDPITDPTLKFRCSMTACIIGALACLEHVLSLIQRYAEMMDCFPNDKPMYRSFVIRGFPWLFEYNCPFSVPLGVVLQIMNCLSTMNWNYSDLFIICISLYLTSRFEQLNKKILAARGKYLPSSFWRAKREKYNRICQLVRWFDDVFSFIIFESFACNLFFICLQLYYALGSGIKQGIPVEDCPNFPSGPFGGYERAIYLAFSLGLLIMRSIAVSLVAARVHSATLVPTAALYAVPSPVYCVEVQRFLDQIHGTTVALTGLRFFNMTRGLLLSVAGTIFTYELVLLQFDTVKIDSGIKINSTINM